MPLVYASSIQSRRTQASATPSASGGAGLFRTLPLREYADSSVYDPFYWEDVEWASARHDGHRPVLRHCQGTASPSATTARFMRIRDDRIVERNRILFDMRNAVTGNDADSLLQVCDQPYASQRELAACSIALKVLRQVGVRGEAS
jgi:hypothetical protein